jgi:CO/xanthine dehydrogenase FAD-binding subunit
MIRNFQYFEPTSVEDACRILTEFKDKAKILAGGTDLLIQMKKDEVELDCLVNIKKISGLDEIIFDGAVLRIGSIVSYRQMLDSAIIKDRFIMLREASLAVGTPQIRNQGTVAGNICNASPSADTAPALIALGAKVKIVSLNKRRSVLVEDFFMGPFQSILEAGEMVTMIEIPSHSTDEHLVFGGCYSWIPKTTTTDETLVGVAVFSKIEPESASLKSVRIALGSVAPTPIRAKQAEEFLRGKAVNRKVFEEAGKIAASECNPRSRASYRRHLVEIFTKNGLSVAASRALGEGYKTT